jgi:hypothetical protein
VKKLSDREIDVNVDIMQKPLFKNKTIVFNYEQDSCETQRTAPHRGKNI